MKHSVRVMSLLVAGASAGGALAQTTPAQTPPPQPPPAATQTQQQTQPKQQQYEHPKARGAAGGAVIGGVAGEAAAGAGIGAGHSRREERRDNRRNKEKISQRGEDAPLGGGARGNSARRLNRSALDEFRAASSSLPASPRVTPLRIRFDAPSVFGQPGRRRYKKRRLLSEPPGERLGKREACPTLRYLTNTLI